MIFWETFWKQTRLERVSRLQPVFVKRAVIVVYYLFLVSLIFLYCYINCISCKYSWLIDWIYFVLIQSERYMCFYILKQSSSRWICFGLKTIILPYLACSRLCPKKVWIRLTTNTILLMNFETRSYVCVSQGPCHSRLPAGRRTSWLGGTGRQVYGGDTVPQRYYSHQTPQHPVYHMHSVSTFYYRI